MHHNPVKLIVAAMITFIGLIGTVALGHAYEEDMTITILESSETRIRVKVEVVPTEIETRRQYTRQNVSRFLIIPFGVTTDFDIVEELFFDTTISTQLEYSSPIDEVDSLADRPNDGETEELTISTTGWNQHVVIGTPFQQRELRGLQFNIQLSDYSVGPVYTICTLLVFDVIFTGTGSYNLPSATVGEFESIYRSRYLNYDSLTISQPINRLPDEMLIIAHDAFIDNMEPFVQWKEQKGIPTTIVPVSQIGVDTTQIADYINTFYQSHNLTWVLLVGDYDEVPSPMYTFDDGYYWSGASDPTYALLDGDDYSPDILVGRMSAEDTSHVNTQVLRSVEYEKAPQGTNWFGKAFMTGSGSSSTYYNNDQLLMMQALTNYTYTDVDTVYSSAPGSDTITALLEDGRCFVSYLGHGTTTHWVNGPSFTFGDVNRLNNANRLPFIISGACLVGKFPESICFAETWMRATDSSG